MQRRRLIQLGAVALLPASCSSTSDFFLGKDNRPAPKPLPPSSGRVATVVQWKHNLGDGGADKGLALKPAYDGGRVYAVSADGRLYAFEGESGAQLWLNTDKHGNIRAVEPAYHATTVQHVAIQGLSRVEDDGTAEIHLWLNGRTFDGDECSDGDYPLIISVPNGQLLPRKLPGKTTTARLIAIADDDISTYADAAAYAATQTGEGSIAANAIIPAGMFTNSGLPRPTAMINGTVLATACKTNALTGQTYYWFHLATYGMEIEAVYPAKAFTTPPQAGNIISGLYWMTGSIDTPAKT